MSILMYMIIVFLEDHNTILELKAKLRQEWNFIDQRYSVPFKLEFSNAEHLQPINVDKIHVIPRKYSCISGNGLFISKKLIESSDTNYIFAWNREYIFQLSRPSVAHSWSVVDIASNNDSKYDKAVRKSVYTVMMRPDSVLYMSNLKDDIPLNDLIVNNNFEITSFRYTKSHCIILFTLKYDWNSDYTTILNGTIECDINNHYSISRIDYSTKEGHRMTAVIDYSMHTAKDGYRPCTNVSRVFRTPDGTELIRSCTYLFHQIDNIDASEFFISHYGLLEPERQIQNDHQPEANFKPYFLITLSIAVIFIVASIYFRRLSFRK